MRGGLQIHAVESFAGGTASAENTHDAVLFGNLTVAEFN
jgi:hypothetical protein